MKNLKYILMATVLLLLYSCKEEYYLYNDIKRIQFGPDITRIYTPSYNLADTLKSYIFFYESAAKQQDTLFFDIYAIGGVSNTDRSFKLEQVAVPGAENAVAGKHYKAFNDASLTSKYVIKSGAVHAKVPVVMLRDATLKTTTVTLKFQIAQNENFSTGEPANVWRKAIFTDRLSQPPAWDNSATLYYFGKYSVVKHNFFIEKTGQKWDNDFILAIRPDYALLTYWRGMVKVALVNYNLQNPGNPLTDEFGEIVVIP
ncbi:MAG TPA: hypothetical protein DEO54_07490 [Rikenellaceae bacterium]|nr:MAG: hypothetical protein A2X20_07235 [Bacteroidetes bacterium GWE2_40_15]HBZ26067.1 hypothetical protein [Rikenellaceae bacterium]